MSVTLIRFRDANTGNDIAHKEYMPQMIIPCYRDYITLGDGLTYLVESRLFRVSAPFEIIIVVRFQF